ncbi:MAG: hypothetical protein AAEJ46_01910, partial [Planctomycetota bacterium]
MSEEEKKTEDPATPAKKDAATPQPAAEVAAEPAAEPAAKPAPGNTPTTPPTPVITEEEKTKLNEEYYTFITGFLEKSRAEDADFSALARAYTEQSKGTKTEVIYRKLDAFSQLDTPEELQGKDQVISRIFSELSGNKKIITPNDATGHWVIHLLQIEEPQPLTLDQAREQVKEALTGDLALESI